MIHNMSAGFIQLFANWHYTHKVSLEDVFKRLSFELGGDGKTITKDQLDSYISNAEKGSIKIGKQKLSVLKQIQSNWNTISNGDDSIDFGDMQKYGVLLVLAFADEGGEASEDESSRNNESVNSLIQKMNLSNADELKSVSENDLNLYLKKLLSDDSGDESNIDAVAILTNLIASSKASSAVQLDA